MSRGPESRFQDLVIAAAKREGWLVYHTHDSRRSEAGYPDLHLVHVDRGLSIFRELKSETGVVSEDQAKWLLALQAAGVDAGVWRPSDWFESNLISEVLSGYTQGDGFIPEPKPHTYVRMTTARIDQMKTMLRGGMTHKKVAEVLGVSLSTVSNHAHKARS